MARTPKTKSKTVAPALPASSPAPLSRSGSKAAAVITLLKAKRGATIPEMMEGHGMAVATRCAGLSAGSLRKRASGLR